MDLHIQDLVTFDAHDRVRAHTAPAVNERIDRLTEGWIAHVADQGEDAIQRRLADLDREWDVDRALMAVFSSVGGGTALLAATGRRFFKFLFGAQLGFLMMHAVAGWCPPAAVLRRMGFRTSREIDAERNALRRLLASR